MKILFTLIALVFFVAGLAACSSGGQRVVKNSSAPLPAGAGFVTVASSTKVTKYAATEADRVSLQSEAPLTSSSATLVVTGMGCPQCASNVDVQLARLEGVHHTDVDLSTGVITITLAGGKKPSPSKLRDAVLDAGFTPIRIRCVR